MDRRFIIWLSLSFLLVLMFAERPKPPEKKEGEQEQAAAAIENENGENDGKEAAGQPGGNQKKAGADESEDAAEQPAEAAANGDDQAEDDAEAAQPEPTVATERVSLGTVDEDSDYRMLVTLTNEGAAVERIELASPRYLDLQDRDGYLGHLALTPAKAGGLLVRVVGAGTPAAAAGVQVGDRLLAMGIKQLGPLSSLEDYAEQLAKTSLGSELKLQVARDGKKLELVAKLARRPLEVTRPESENVRLWSKKLPPGLESPPSFLTTLEQLDDKQLKDEQAEFSGMNLREGAWEIVERTIDSVTFRKQILKTGLTFVKRYRLEKVPDELRSNADYPAYGLTLGLTIENSGKSEHRVAYRLDGPNGLPIEGWWYANKIGHKWGAVGLRDVMTRTFASNVEQFSPATISGDGVEPLEGSSFAYLGVDAQYFSVMLLPEKQDPDELWLEQVDLVSLSPKPTPRTSEGRYANVTCRLKSVAKTLAPGDKLQNKYTVFAGPKRPDLLAQYKAVDSPSYSLEDLLTYGWFSQIAKAMLWVLHFFYDIVGNYGISIILLTVLVRSCMFPISRKQAQSMAKMQELKPEMERIKEKHKADMQKQSQAMQELYRKHGVNPLAGCLPMLIQLPVFVGLYRGLAVDIELRQASLFGQSIHWCSNLAAPDMFWDWSSIMPDAINSGDGMFSPGPYLNVLPLVTVGLFLLQQKMFMPEPANDQAAMQQKIMKFMMIFMGLMFYKVPSGLCLYFIASSLWGIAERKLLPKPTEVVATTGATGTEAEATTSANPKPSLTSRLLEFADKQASQKNVKPNGKPGNKTRDKKKRKR